MRYIFIVLLTLITICRYIVKDKTEIGTKYDYTFEHDIPIDSVESIIKWIYENIDYRGDSELSEDIKDYWQLPHETYIQRKGDCEDFSILMIQLLYEMNPDVEASLVRVGIGDTFHIIVYYLGDFYEPQWGSKIDDPGEVIWLCPYGKAMWMTYNYHDSIGEYSK